MATPSRLKDRMFTRALVAEEVTDMKHRSAVDMKRNLNWWDLIWLGIGAVVGAGIFVITGVEAKNHAGPAIIISYAIAGFSAMLSVFCYTEFAVEIPVAGGSFAYLRVELGDFVAFIGAGNIVLEYVIGGAAVARGWTSYFSNLIFSGAHVSDKLRITTNLAEGYQYSPLNSAFSSSPGSLIEGMTIACQVQQAGSHRGRYPRARRVAGHMEYEGDFIRKLDRVHHQHVHHRLRHHCGIGARDSKQFDDRLHALRRPRDLHGELRALLCLPGLRRGLHARRGS